MGWQIDLFRVPDGVDPHVVRDVQYGWEEHDGYAVPDAGDDTDRWIRHVIELLETVAPDLKLVIEHDGEPMVSFSRGRHIEHVRLWQTEGRLIVNAYPGTVDLRVNFWNGEAYDGATFDALWASCRLLAERAECAVFPQYDDDPVDMTMDPKEARRVHNWA